MNSTTVIAKIKEMQQPSFFNVQKSHQLITRLETRINPALIIVMTITHLCFSHNKVNCLTRIFLKAFFSCLENLPNAHNMHILDHWFLLLLKLKRIWYKCTKICFKYNSSAFYIQQKLSSATKCNSVHLMPVNYNSQNFEVLLNSQHKIMLSLYRQSVEFLSC